MHKPNPSIEFLRTWRQFNPGDVTNTLGSGYVAGLIQRGVAKPAGSDGSPKNRGKRGRRSLRSRTANRD